MQKFKRFLWNAIAVTVGSLCMRGLGMGFGVYLTSKIGADGMGLFSLISTVYSLAVTFAASGINLAVTRVVAEQLGAGCTGGVRRAVRGALCYAACFGFAAAVLLYLSAPFIAGRLLCDERAMPSLRLLAFSLPAMAFANVMSGYFIAMRRAYADAGVNFLAHLTHIALSAVLLELFCPRGLTYACLCVCGGCLLGELLQCLLSFVLYLSSRRRDEKGAETVQRNKKGVSPERHAETGRHGFVMRSLLRISVPIALTAYVRAALVTLEHILIPAGLSRHAGDRKTALAAYGTVHGMVMPVLLFPMAILSAFAGLIIPELAEYHVKRADAAIRTVCARVLGMTLLYAIGVSGALLCCAGQLGTVLYKSAEAGRYLRILGALVPIMYLDHAVDAMLKGLDEQVASMRYNIIDASLSVLAISTLLPRFGMTAYLLILFGSELFNASLSVMRLLRVVRLRVRLFKWVLLPLGCCLCAEYLSAHLLAVSGVLYQYPSTALLVQMGIYFVLYFAFLILTRSVTRADAAMLAARFRAPGA